MSLVVPLYVTDPFVTAIVLSVPINIDAPLIEVTVNESFSGSLSAVPFIKGVIEILISSSVLYESSVAIGASFTGLITIVSVAESFSPFPSLIV